MPDPTEWIGLQTFFGVGDLMTKDAEENLIPVDRILMAAPTVYDVFCGLDFAPGAASAMERWRTGRRTEALAAGVANFSWPGPAAGQENRTSIVQFTAGLGVASVSITVDLITDAAILNVGLKNHVLRMQVVNNSLPALPMVLPAPAVGKLPLRYLPGVAALNIPHGQIGVMEVETDGNTIGYVRAARILGDTVPPIWAITGEGRGTGAPILQIASFTPYLYEGETALLFMGRNTGTAVILPTDRGWAFPADGDLTNGGTYNGTTSGLRVAVSTTRGANGAIAGTNTLSNQQHLAAVALRGAAPTDFVGVTTTGTTVAFPAFTGIAPGGFVLYETWVQQSTGVVPDGGIGVHAAGDLPSASGWTARLRRVEPDANGNVAPPNVVLGAAATCHIIAIRVEPT